VAHWESAKPAGSFFFLKGTALIFLKSSSCCTLLTHGPYFAGAELFFFCWVLFALPTLLLGKMKGLALSLYMLLTLKMRVTRRFYSALSYVAYMKLQCEQVLSSKKS